MPPPENVADTLSEVLGEIYDAAVDPGAWPAALEAIGGAVAGVGAAISIVDRDPARLVSTQQWFKPGVFDGKIERWMAFHAQRNFGPDATRFFALAQAHASFDPDAPLVISRVLDAATIEKMPVFQEFAKPLGLGDAMSIMVHATDAQFVTIDVFRHATQATFEDSAMATMRQFAPHLRRAFAISLLLELKTLHMGAYVAALDALRCAVVLVDADARVLYANRAAHELAGRGDVIRLSNGTLSAPEKKRTTALRALVRDPTDGQGKRLAPAVRLGPDDAAAVATVLPLSTAELQSRFGTGAAALVFIQTSADMAGSLDAIASAFQLSPTETRVLGHLLDGRTPSEVADAMGVGVSTIRSHLTNLFIKTNTERQAELVAIVSRLLPPIGTGASGHDRSR
jgi:DNA-binding CsgD family transcriptional regulator/PAS domain-containing protein